ncbi:MAG: esterase/lipase family protein, partial [Solirubrobacteraceae bacterium]
MTDVVVVVPGITGSSLVDAEGHEFWGVSPGGLTRALRTLGGSIKRHTLPPGQEDGPAPDGVTPTGLIGALHAIPGLWTPVVGYQPLLDFLRQARFGLVDAHPGQVDAPAGNLLLFGYDWRLSNRYTATCLKCQVDEVLTRWRDECHHPDAKVIFICHSMGGLVVRYYLDVLRHQDVARAVITLGTPHRGSLNSLDQLVNGVHRGKGPFVLDLTAFGRSLPSSYQLLPEYACIAGDGALKKTTETALPWIDPDRARDGMSFYDELNDAADPTYPMIPVIGIGQPTLTTAAVNPAGTGVDVIRTIDGEDLAGDGTVPRLSARPKRMTERDPLIRGVADGHGALAVCRSVLDQLDVLLTSTDTVYRGADGLSREERTIGLATADLHEAGEPVEVHVHSALGTVLELVAFDETAREVGRAAVRFDRDT